MDNFKKKIFYRISNNSYTNKKRIGNKQNCFMNMLKHFPDWELVVVGDNLFEPDLKKMIEKHSNSVHYTSLGNANSFRYILDLATSETEDTNTIVYFMEDDYIHRENASKVLLEGVQISDYVSLYDHPDKYQNFGPNPFIKDGGELSRVLISPSCHWKTSSATMTFASSVKVLREDKHVLSKFAAQSFKLFSKLLWRPVERNFGACLGACTLCLFEKINFFKKKRRLIVPLPGYSTHAESKYLGPFNNWLEELRK